MTSNTFFVFLPSNVTDYPDNRPNHFRVRLPKPLYFTGSWQAGLYSISYPYSWPATIGTLDEQYIGIHITDQNKVNHREIRIPVPPRSHTDVESLKKLVQETLKNQIDEINLLLSGPRHSISPPLSSSPPKRAKRELKKEVFTDSPPYEESGLASPPGPESPDTSPPKPIKNEGKKESEKPPPTLQPQTPQQKTQLQKPQEKQPQIPSPLQQQQSKSQLQTPKPVAEAKPVQKPPAQSTKQTQPLAKQEGQQNAQAQQQSSVASKSLTLVEKPNSQVSKTVPVQSNQTTATTQKPAPAPPAAVPPASVTPQKPIEKQSKPVPVQSNQTTTTTQNSIPAPPAAVPPASVTPQRPIEKQQSKPLALPLKAAPTPEPPTAATQSPPAISKGKEKENNQTKLLDALFGSEVKEKSTKTDIVGFLVGERDGEKEDRVPFEGTPYIWQINSMRKFENNNDLELAKEVVASLKIEYLYTLERFKLTYTHPQIDHVSFSAQLGYVLGFENSNLVSNNTISKFGCDLRGGFTSFAVYVNGLTENVIFGNSLSSLLRVVSVSGKPGDFIEKNFDSQIFSKVIVKEISEIEIELRTMDNGRLVPFSYGTVMIVLIFKKVIDF